MGYLNAKRWVFFFRAMEREPTFAPAFFMSRSASVTSHNKLHVLANNTPQMRLPRELGRRVVDLGDMDPLSFLLMNSNTTGQGWCGTWSRTMALIPIGSRVK
jgi:hypothetical protein